MATEPVGAEPTPEPPAETEAAAPRRSKPNLLVFGVLAGLFILTSWGSWQLRSLFIQTPDPADLPGIVPPAHAKPAVPAEILEHGDDMLRQHRHADARSCYQELLENGVAKSAAIDYRLALCSEMVGQLDDAIALYRKTIGTSSARSLTLASHLGMARCMLRHNRPIEARRLLGPFLFDESRRKDLSEDLTIDAYYLVALSLACDGPMLVGEDELLSFAAIPLEAQLHLDEIADGVAPRQVVAGVPNPVPLVVKKATPNEPALVRCAVQPDRAAVDLLTELATEGGMKVEWTADAKKSLADRALSLHLHDWELRDVLELAADHLDLACLIDNNVVRFATRTETPGLRLTALRRNMIERSLLAAVRADARHPYAAAAMLELGNNALAQRRWAEGAAWYQRIPRAAGASPYVASSYFNLACAHLGKHDIPNARKAFFRAADQSPGDELALRAWIRIGQLYLYEDDVRQAIPHLRRAQSFAARSPHQQLACLVLASAYLHAGDPEAARQTLVQNRAVLQQERLRPIAAFLDAYARYRFARASRGSPNQREVNDLVEGSWSLSRSGSALCVRVSSRKLWPVCSRIARVSTAYQAFCRCSPRKQSRSSRRLNSRRIQTNRRRPVRARTHPRRRQHPLTLSHWPSFARSGTRKRSRCFAASI